jgi:hypothetical protein
MKERSGMIAETGHLLGPIYARLIVLMGRGCLGKDYPSEYRTYVSLVSGSLNMYHLSYHVGFYMCYTLIYETDVLIFLLPPYLINSNS